MTDFSSRPTPTPEETAAIVAALAAVRDEDSEKADNPENLKRRGWRLAGLLGTAPPRRMDFDGSLWSYSSWEGMV